MRGNDLLIGILSDTHNRVERTRDAVQLLISEGVEALIHCGDLACPDIVAACSVLPFYFVFGNHDSDMVCELERSAKEYGAHCLGWGGEITLDDKRIAIVHGHLTMDLRPLLEAEPDYLLSGHSHVATNWMEGRTHRINPGALFRATIYTVALLDLKTDGLWYITVED